MIQWISSAIKQRQKQQSSFEISASEWYLLIIDKKFDKN